MKNFNPSLTIQELVNPSTGEISIRYREGSPQNYRFDASKGIVNLNGEIPITKKGEEFSFIPIALRIFEGELFDMPRRSWAELFFVNQERNLCSLLFHGFTVQELKDLESELYYSDLKINEIVLTLKPTEKTSKETSNKFFIGYFSFREAPKDYVNTVFEIAKGLSIYRDDTRKDTQNNLLAFNYKFLPEVHKLEESKIEIVPPKEEGEVLKPSETVSPDEAIEKLKSFAGQ